MQKIMFNNDYNLNDLVISNYKKKTRRIIGEAGKIAICRTITGQITDVCLMDKNGWLLDNFQISPKYKINEIVAIAQNYKDIGYKIFQYENEKDKSKGYIKKENEKEIPMKWPIKGYENKMFVKSELMPHQIEIMNISVEKLQNISEKDCMEEGIRYNEENKKYYYTKKKKTFYFDTAIDAFASLIDKISGKGTWNKNPYVFVYSFKLIK